MKNRTHSIIKSYVTKSGRLETRPTTHFSGATDAEAMHVFDKHVRFAEQAWEKPTTWNGAQVRITAIVLIDAAENVLGEWTHRPEVQVAA